MEKTKHWISKFWSLFQFFCNYVTHINQIVCPTIFWVTSEDIIYFRGRIAVLDNHSKRKIFNCSLLKDMVSQSYQIIFVLFIFMVNYYLTCIIENGVKIFSCSCNQAFERNIIYCSFGNRSIIIKVLMQILLNHNKSSK